MIELGLHTDNWRPLSLGHDAAIAKIAATGIKHIEFCAIHGQKTYNGVALISRHKIEDIREGLPGDKSDEQARYIEGLIATKTGAVRVASIYAPNGNPVDTEKYTYKLKWTARIRNHVSVTIGNNTPRGTIIMTAKNKILPRLRSCRRLVPFS